MAYFVYMILSKHKNRIISYVGYAKNVQNRLTKHNSSKGAKFTKGSNWKLIYKKKYKTKSIAMKHEHLLKKNQKLDKPIITPTTKDTEDIPITPKEIVDKKYMTQEEMDFIFEKALELYNFGSE